MIAVKMLMNKEVESIQKSTAKFFTGGDQN